LDKFNLLPPSPVVPSLEKGVVLTTKDENI